MHLSRRTLLAASIATLPASLLGACAPRSLAAPTTPTTASGPRTRRVGFAISPRFTVIDTIGPWETFQDVKIGEECPFDLCTVGPSHDALEASGGLRVVPHWSYADAPPLDVIVVGAQTGGPALQAWLRARANDAALVMSVCTGAFQVARAGLFRGKSATTHHDYYDSFAETFPDVKLVRGERFVDEGSVCSAGGLTSGIDLALHVVKRFHGEAIANATARYMEFVPTPRRE